MSNTFKAVFVLAVIMAVASVAGLTLLLQSQPAQAAPQEYETTWGCLKLCGTDQACLDRCNGKSQG